MAQATGTEPRPRESDWTELREAESGDAIVAALAAGGVSKLFFCSGSDVTFLQEAVAKARHLGTPTPSIVTVMHESVALHAAIGFTQVSGMPAATAAHVEAGTLAYGGAIHTAYAEHAPVMMISGATARAYPGSMRGGRDNPINWSQERFDQRELLQGYAKWRFRLEMQDNPGLTVSRGLQVALSAPRGPAFLSIPREVGLAKRDRTVFPTVEQMGLARRPAADPGAIDQLAGWLLEAERPLVIAGTSGRDPETVPELVRIAELVGIPVTDNGFTYRTNFPGNHPLANTGPLPVEADVILALDRELPWVPAGERPIDFADGVDDATDLPLTDPRRAPSADCRVATIAEDPVASDMTILELTADLRIAADPLQALRALAAALEDRIDAAGRERAAARLAAAEERQRRRFARFEGEALATVGDSPIDPRLVGLELARILDPEAILLDDALTNSRVVTRYCRMDRPGSYYSPFGTGGGWGAGAALGAKLAEPGRDVILASGDGFYAYGVPSAALWSARHYGAPFLSVIFVNRRYSTGVEQLRPYYPESHTSAQNFEGATFDPPPDFAAEGAAAGALGITVEAAEELRPALERGVAATRDGQSAVVAVRVR
ncbi:MAG: thiamine pyrophosphate-binding protein [Solirubrobacterales bacterium]